MAEVMAALLLVVFGAVFLMVCALPLLIVIRLWWGSYAISKARKQAESILAVVAPISGEREEIGKVAAVLSTSRNSYNKALLAKLQERL